MKQPFFSVLIDTYNYGQFVEEAISSALTQDFPVEEREILVVDDGSTDDTEQRLQKFGDSIRYLRKSNGGQASALNFGFEHADGEVISLLDADDVWLPGKLARVYQVFHQNPETGMVYHQMHGWKASGETDADPYFVPISGIVPRNRGALLQYPMVGTSCLSFRRKSIEKLMPVPAVLRSQADAYLTALIIFVAAITPVPEYLGKYRLHGANMFRMNTEHASRRRLEHRMAMRAALLAEIQQWLQESGHDINSRDIRAYLKQWTLAQDQDKFILSPPGRWQYLLHLLDYPRTYGEIMSTRHRAYCYLRASAALFLGYHHLHLLDDLRRKRKQIFPATTSNKSPVGEENSAKASD